MKGTFFKRPLEFRLSIEGETWCQGDTVTGTLTVKNHGTEPATLEGISARLARGSMRKVRAKSENAFETLASKSFDPAAKVDPGAEASLEWSFTTDRSCPITDSLASLFMVYGRGESGDTIGNLELPIVPHALITEFVTAFRIQFRFIEKSRRMSKGWVEFKLTPPDSQAFASLDHVLVSFRFDGDSLEVGYAFNVKKVEATAASIDMKKSKRELMQKLGPAEYKTTTGRVNHELLERYIKDALGNVEAKILF